MQLSERYASLTAALAAIMACGGKAVVDGGGTGGAATSGGGTSNAGGTPNGPGPGPGPGPGVGGATPGVCVDDTFAEPQAAPGDCQAACEILFCCSQEECAAISSADRDAFRAFCVPGCEEQMALAAVVNGERCAQTVSTIRGASFDFAEVCDNGFGP